MKLLLICDDPVILSRVNLHFTPAGYSLIHYANPLKAMDNFAEAAPDAVLFRVRDFPRHWKLAFQFLRESFTREQSPFILLTDKSFDKEEVEKAHFMKVNAILSEESPMEELESTILHYKISPKTRMQMQLIPLKKHKMDFMFMNPESLQLVNARVLELSEKGAALRIEEAVLKDSLPGEGAILKNCSLNTGKNIIDLNAQVEEARHIMVIRFLDRPTKWQQEIEDSLKILV